MDEKSDRKELERRLEQAKRMVAMLSRLEPPECAVVPITASRRPCIPTKENSILISMLLET
jgi:hypothetical protein